MPRRVTTKMNKGKELREKTMNTLKKVDYEKRINEFKKPHEANIKKFRKNLYKLHKNHLKRTINDRKRRKQTEATKNSIKALKLTDSIINKIYKAKELKPLRKGISRLIFAIGIDKKLSSAQINLLQKDIFRKVENAIRKEVKKEKKMFTAQTIADISENELLRIIKKYGKFRKTPKKAKQQKYKVEWEEEETKQTVPIIKYTKPIKANQKDLTRTLKIFSKILPKGTLKKMTPNQQSKFITSMGSFVRRGRLKGELEFFKLSKLLDGKEITNKEFKEERNKLMKKEAKEILKNLKINVTMQPMKKTLEQRLKKFRAKIEKGSKKEKTFELIPEEEVYTFQEKDMIKPEILKEKDIFRPSKKELELKKEAKEMFDFIHFAGKSMAFSSTGLKKYTNEIDKVFMKKGKVEKTAKIKILSNMLKNEKKYFNLKEKQTFKKRKMEINENTERVMKGIMEEFKQKKITKKELNKRLKTIKSMEKGFLKGMKK